MPSQRHGVIIHVYDMECSYHLCYFKHLSFLGVDTQSLALSILKHTINHCQWCYRTLELSSYLTVFLYLLANFHVPDLPSSSSGNRYFSFYFCNFNYVVVEMGVLLCC